MKKEFKIVICGGGSTYTAGIVKNLLEEEELKIKELWLYDIDHDGTDMRKTGHFQGSFPENAQMK